MADIRIPEKSLVVYKKTTSAGHVTVKTGVRATEIKRRSSNTYAYKVATFNQTSQTTIEAQEYIPVVAYVSAETFQYLQQQGIELEEVVEPTPEVSEPVVEEEEVTLSPCNMGACPMPSEEE